MNLENIIAILIIYNLRRHASKAGNTQKWDKILKIGIWIAIGLLILSIMGLPNAALLKVLTFGFLASLIFAVYRIPEFQSAKPIVLAGLPYLLISFIGDLLGFINPELYAKWENYFETALFFTLLWAAAMLIINNKQKKALEKERIKAEEREKEHRITESLKAELEIQVAERTAALTLQKNKLEKTLNELKATQNQLIHAEKMASLGELTAGIAHEIQNPLNFVNNFSEVSNELIQEMNTELENGDLEEAKSIANDIQQNLKKINHHGKRAEAIVRGMLMHSRSNSGKKELTDINALADEYLRLSYHGLRAKDKSFNADFTTDFDPALPKIMVIPEDFGRVLLNLINNAFYACADKSHMEALELGKDRKERPKSIDAYKPKVKISTKMIDQKIRISVSDNGSGIPEAIKTKIFQPFFTTKPTGQGTGLGLSLSYDIVMAHGGDIRVESKEGEGTTFTILLPLD
ncbi:sensor histidine kinase [Rhodonellum sp.]|uniref:sensor histidine kinase n=1 Tax=Rhodonellum sp. TaxID=2231180 RepID=UPI002716FF97|nr:ATP-binding protein [Rhodonellum sp.]MDO9554310.1 ATP-binding protein [Rhodonellum sp.]